MSGQEEDMERQGIWNENALRLLPPVAEVSYAGIAGRAFDVMMAGRRIGTMRRRPSGWMLKLEGYAFSAKPGEGAARFGLARSPVRFFQDLASAKAGVARALVELAECRAGPSPEDGSGPAGP